MDQASLVSEGTKLVGWLDDTEIKPRAAMWVYNSETEAWRLWIVPASKIEKLEFYQILSKVISRHRDDIPGFDISLVQFKSDKNPAVSGLSKMIHMEGLGSAHFSNNTMNGYLLPDGIVLRMAI